MRRFWSLLLPFMLAFAMGGCKIDSINYFPPKPAQVRVMNLLPGIPAVDVVVGSTPLWTGVAFQSVTGYLNIENTVQQASVFIAGTTTLLAQGSFPLGGEQPYTLTLSGTPSQPAMILLQEVVNPPTNGTVLISAYSAAANVPSIDLYAGPVGQDITNANPTYFSLNFNGTTFAVSFAPGVYEIKATISGSNPKVLVYDSGPITITGNTSLFFVPYAVGSSTLVNAMMLQSKGPTNLQNNLLARVKTVQAAPGNGPVDLLQSGVPVIANVAYGGVGGYNNVPARAAQVMSFANTGTTTPTLAAVTTTLAPATDQTIFITGLPGAQQAVVLNDLNLPAPNGTVKVRVVNASPNTGPITVTAAPSATNTPLATGLPWPTASGYNFMAAGVYSFRVTDTATGTTLLTIPDTLLTAPQTTTIYVIGPAGTLTGVLTRDF